MANSHVLLGINPKLNIANYLDGSATVKQLLINAPSGLKFIAGGTAVNDILNTQEQDRYKVIRGMEDLSKDTDILVFDAAAGGADSTAQAQPDVQGEATGGDNVQDVDFEEVKE